MEDPFKSIGGITYVFGDNRDKMIKLLKKIDEINDNAEVVV